MLFRNKDVLGKALIDYMNEKEYCSLIIHSSFTKDKYTRFRSKERIPLESFFCNPDNEDINNLAYSKCYGKVLDIGAGSGTNSLEMIERNIDVDSIDVSEGAVSVMRKRGLENVYHSDIKSFDLSSYDTLAFWGNNHGLFGDFKSFKQFIAEYLKTNNPLGQVIIVSPYSSIPVTENQIDQDIDYIELTMMLEYRVFKSKPFKWFMINPAFLKIEMEKCGFFVELVYLHNKNQCLITITRFYL